jgi:hypothetical protein
MMVSYGEVKMAKLRLVGTEPRSPEGLCVFGLVDLLPRLT